MVATKRGKAEGINAIEINGQLLEEAQSVTLVDDARIRLPKSDAYFTLRIPQWPSAHTRQPFSRKRPRSPEAGSSVGDEGGGSAGDASLGDARPWWLDESLVCVSSQEEMELAAVQERSLREC
mgnify:CR=1 FL=1